MSQEEAAAREYRLAMANLLGLFRTLTDETQQQIDERLGLPAGKWGRWERGAFPPKAHELATLYEGFREWGMEADWLLSPPDLPGLQSIRERLTALALAGTIAADAAEARAMVRRLQAGARLVAVRDRRSA